MQSPSVEQLGATSMGSAWDDPVGETKGQARHSLFVLSCAGSWSSGELKTQALHECEYRAVRDRGTLQRSGLCHSVSAV